MNNMINKLMDLGLSQYESKCYLALLQDYPASPYQISKVAGIPTSKIYEVVNRLKTRGLLVEVSGKEKGCIPKDPEIALSEWKERYLQNLEEMTRELKSTMAHKSHHVVWNITGKDEVFNQGRRLLAGAKQSVSLATSKAFLNAISSELRRLQGNISLMNLILYGQKEDSFSDLPIKGIKPIMHLKKKRDITVMAVDKKIAFFATMITADEEIQGAWTDNPAIVSVVEEYVDEKLFLEQAIENNWLRWSDIEV